MPASPFYHRDDDRDATHITLAASDMSLRDHSPMFAFDDHPQYDPIVSDSDAMIFGLELDDAFNQQESKPQSSWDSHYPSYSMSSIPFPGSPDSTTSQLEPVSNGHSRRFDSTFSNCSSNYYPPTPEFSESALYSNWIADPDAPRTASMPIPIPGGHAQSPTLSSSYAAFSENSAIFPDVSPFSPTTAFAALQPLPLSPPDDAVMMDQLRSELSGAVSPPANLFADPSAPSWASQLWAAQSTVPSPGAPVPIGPLSTEDNFATQRQRVPVRRGTSVTQLFQSSSAPSPSHARPPLLHSRPYSTRRSESISEHDDRDATVRKKKRPAEEGELQPREKRSESPPLKSTLRPPKLAPSAWQLYFTDWIQRHQASSSKKLNVAQAAKEAGQEYAKLSDEEKEPYRRRSLEAKEARERELNAYMRTLTPEDIKRENQYRTAQRKAGKSRKGNLKDPNAPKKPLSAYFMFLQRIRSDPELVQEVFGDETETTKQSVLAAGKWRSMTDEQRKPFLAQAEQEKLEYESARKMYEDGTTGYGTSINFSILPGSPINLMPIPRNTPHPLKQEALSSESESDDFMTDDGADHTLAIPRRR
ncbi:Mismatch-binding protein cmb1 [Trametes pubescens]|uniref:Mismatch-binding protein cmb1 n=1 Tax=Trametes pubescens TaxID=154538 RepID=A0A1M2VCU9_TRAPU|nr:Mismatch-binding protein cmb1 [Trametes pubescens]